MSTLYLHIGMPKTGTSYIQKFLQTNNEVLKKNGCIYPDFGVKFDKIQGFRSAHFLISNIKDEDGNRLKSKEEEIENECFEKLFDMLKEYPNAIVSDEAIWNAAERKRGEDFWKNLKSRLNARGVELKTIVYLRRQDMFVQSFWAQRVKENNVSIPLKRFINKRLDKLVNLDYYERLNQICEVVGKENMLVRVYEKEQYIGPEKSIVSDFLTTVGLEYNDEYEQPSRLINFSLTGIYLETKRELNKIEGFSERKGYVQELMRQVVRNNDDVRQISPNEFISRKVAEKFLKNYEESNEKVAREYLAREDGVLFYDEQKISGDSAPEYTVSDYVRVFAQMLEIQNDKLTHEQEQVNRYKEYIRNYKLQIKDLNAENKQLQSTVDWVTTSFPKKVSRKFKRIFGRKKHV